MSRRLSRRAEQVDETAFPLSVWLENSKKMIGQPRYVLVGATYGKDENDSFTRSQMQDLVKRFLASR